MAADAPGLAAVTHPYEHRRRVFYCNEPKARISGSLNRTVVGPLSNSLAAVMRSAVAKGQQIVEGMQLDDDTMDEVVVPRRDRLRDESERGGDAVDEAAEFVALAQ